MALKVYLRFVMIVMLAEASAPARSVAARFQRPL
jgi:hypothetical protein